MQTHPAKQGRAANACGLRVPGFMGSAFFLQRWRGVADTRLSSSGMGLYSLQVGVHCCLCGGACVLRAVSVTTRDRCFSELCVFSPLEDTAS